MKIGTKNLVTVWLSISVVLIIIVALQGCRAAESKNEAAAMVKPAAEQTNCPIMGMAVDKSVYTEYKGKKVYFCCAGCIDKFRENPEQYVSKLPQFNP